MSPEPAATLTSLDDHAEVLSRLRALEESVVSVFQGKPMIVRLSLVCLLAGGHLLLEDIPGVGKTTLARALARSMSLPFRRIQFTSDLLPSDILGVSIFDEERRTFELHPGPIFHNVVLADEINRASPRTQSALLEAMQEQRVTLDNQTHALPCPFFVIATQNPHEYHGTYPLPESQLDRFLFRLSIGYPPVDIERRLLSTRDRLDPVQGLTPVLSGEDLVELQKLVDCVHVESSLIDYMMAFITLTRQSPRLALGASTRTNLSTLRAVKAHALLNNRLFCLPDDFLALLVPAVAHRVRLTGSYTSASGEREESERVVRELLEGVPLPR